MGLCALGFVCLKCRVLVQNGSLWIGNLFTVCHFLVMRLARARGAQDNQPVFDRVLTMSIFLSVWAFFLPL